MPDEKGALKGGMHTPTITGHSGLLARGTGATEQQVSMQATVPQRLDSHGSKVEEMAGTGEHDAPGG
jgi:hypothetical protein